MFTAIIQQASKFKNLIELLFNNLDNIVLCIDKQGIFINENINCINISVSLVKDYFAEYEFSYDNPIYLKLGINVAHDFKSIKNKSKIKFSILQLSTEIEPLILKIETFSVEGDLYTSIILTTEIIDNHKIDNAIDYNYSDHEEIKIIAKDFTSICKTFKPGLLSISKIEGKLVITTSISGLKTKEYVFGKSNDKHEEIINFIISSEKILKLTKLSSISNKFLTIVIRNNFLIFKVENEIGVIIIKYS